MTLDQQFNTLNDKLQLLLKQYSRVQKENERLRTELQQVRDRELEIEQRMEELHQQNTILKLSGGGLDEKDKKDLEKKIGQYIKEIDRCISVLSQ
jgi:DNA anti-recombination protein RmuC